MTKLYHVICSDLDGTLLNSKEVVSSKDFQAIATWQQQGGLFGITSGRSMPGVDNLVLKGINLKPNFIVYANGGIIRNIKGQLIEHQLPDSLAAKILEDVLAMPHKNVTVLLNGVSHGVVENNVDTYEQTTESWAKGHWTLTQTLKYLASGKHFSKVSVTTNDIAEDQQFVQYFQQYNLTVTTSAARYVEVTAQGTSKLKGIQEALLGRYPLTQVAAVGDYLNDCAMLSGVGRGYAVGNALPAVKRIADAVLDDHDHYPIAEMIADLATQNLIK